MKISTENTIENGERKRSDNETRLTFKTKFIYSMPSFSMGGLVIFATTLLPKFYIDTVGVNAGAMGNITGILLFFYAASQPLAGFISDKLRTKWGQKLPVIGALSIPFGISYFCTFSPPSVSSISPGLWVTCFGSILTACWGAVEVCISYQNARLKLFTNKILQIPRFATSLCPR